MEAELTRKRLAIAAITPLKLIALVAALLVLVLLIQFIRSTVSATWRAETMTQCTCLLVDFDRQLKDWKSLPDGPVDISAYLGKLERFDTGWPKGRADGVPVDRWGHPFAIQVTKRGVNLTIKIRSRGPDGKLDTPDDIALEETLH